MIKLIRKIRWLIVPLLICTAICVLMKTVLFLGYVPTASMEPTIPAESWILGFRHHGTIQKGDIVIFEHNGKTLVKRVAATEGDVVYFNDLNHDVAINEGLSAATRKVEVPSGCFLMLGDNVSASIDSRYWRDPFITEERIIAKLF